MAPRMSSARMPVPAMKKIERHVWLLHAGLCGRMHKLCFAARRMMDAVAVQRSSGTALISKLHVQAALEGFQDELRPV